MTHTFKKIKVWKKAHELVIEIYKDTKSFPENEKFGLTSQIRRASVSIATNIVEGYKRKSNRDFMHFLNIADSSLEETKYHLLLARDLNYMNENKYKKLLNLSDEVGRMLNGFQRKINENL